MLGLEEITFTYYGMRNQKFDVAAVCQTEGGPEQLRFSSGKPCCGVIFFDIFLVECFRIEMAVSGGEIVFVRNASHTHTQTVFLYFDKSSLQSLSNLRM